MRAPGGAGRRARRVPSSCHDICARLRGFDRHKNKFSGNNLLLITQMTSKIDIKRSASVMDIASAYGAEGSRFDPWVDRKLFCVLGRSQTVLCPRSIANCFVSWVDRAARPCSAPLCNTERAIPHDFRAQRTCTAANVDVIARASLHAPKPAKLAHRARSPLP